MKSVLYSIILLLPLVSLGQDMVTDRPDITESAVIVPAGSLQVEQGFSFAVDGSDSELGLLSTLLRYGINDFFELRSEVFPVLNPIVSDAGLGIAPVSLGLKIRLTESNNSGIQMALLTHFVFAQLATAEYREPHNALRVILAAQKDVHEQITLSANGGFSYDTNTSLLQYVYSISAGYAPFDRLGFFAEQFTVSGLPGSLQPGDYAIDAGMTLLLRPLLQLDASAGFSLTSPARYFFSAGISWRIDRNNQ